MKKQFLLIILGVCTLGSVFAQKEKPLPNTDFENWTLDDNTGDFELDEYISIDQLVASFGAPGVSDQVKRGTLTDVHNGTYSVVMTSDTIPTPFGTFQIPGVVFLASSVDQFQNGIGVDYAFKPIQIKGWYKYEPHGDTCAIIVAASKFDEASQQRINLGFGTFNTSDTVTSFKEFTIDIQYDPNYDLIPDTLTLVISASPVNMGQQNQTVQPGATLTVDDFSVKLGTVAGFTNSPSKTIRVGQEVSFTNASSGPWEKFKWTFPDTTFATIENPKYTFKTKGLNNVKLELFDAKDSLLSASIVALTVQGPVGIKEVATATEVITTNLYPNPANSASLLTYKIDKAENISIKIADITGKVVRTYNEGNKSGINKFLISTNDLPNGLYFVNITGGEKTITKKLTINH